MQILECKSEHADRYIFKYTYIFTTNVETKKIRIVCFQRVVGI